MRVALFQGIGLVSWQIEFITRSQYSHAAWVFDEQAAWAAATLVQAGHAPKLKYYGVGAVVEAWQGGVKNSPSISTLHTKGTKVDFFEFVPGLSLLEDAHLVEAIAGDIGDPYSYLNVLRFITRRPGIENGSWFCSEEVFQRAFDIGRALFQRTKAWQVPPDWLQRSPGLKFSHQEGTV